MRAAIYTRVSTEDQAKEGFSLEAQMEMLRDYCEAQGWEVAGEYVDDGYSGRNTNRPAYRRMMAEIDDWDILAVIKMDRIHRNSKNFMIMMEKLESKGKGFTSSTESLDTSNAIGRFVVDMIQRLAQLESEQIGERTYVGLREKAESAAGLLGFRPPFGYMVKDRTLKVVEDEAEIVRRIFDMYLADETMDSIAYRLNHHGELTRDGKAWTVYNVRHILHNPVYAGFLRWEDLIVPFSHRALMDITEFNMVQRKISSRVKDRRKRRTLVLPEDPDVCVSIKARYAEDE